jgi:ribosome-associated toxin RatA of RatAB toxin-antitoxin module
MSTFETSVVVAAPARALFDLSQDYRRRLEWDPFLCEARLVEAEAAAVGVRAWCVSKRPRFGMETEYVTFQPPDVVAVKMTRGPIFLESFAGSWRFESLDERTTRVAMRYTLRTKPSWLARIAGPFFEHDTRRRLDAFKAAVEAGRVMPLGGVGQRS